MVFTDRKFCLQAQCIEYFYLWKKTPAGLKVLRRPAAGSQKRSSGGGLRRIRARGPNRTLSSDFVDCSPSSGDEERESDDSDKDMSAYQCSNCSATGKCVFFASNFKHSRYMVTLACFYTCLIIRVIICVWQSRKSGITPPRIRRRCCALIVDSFTKSTAN